MNTQADDEQEGPPSAQGKGDGEKPQSIQIKYDQGEPPESFVASHYSVHAAEEAVTVAFRFSTPQALAAPAIVVWMPRKMLTSTILRETDRFAKAIGVWVKRGPAEMGRDDPPPWPVDQVFSANAASAAVSDVGAAMRFYWFSTAKFAQRQHSVTAEVVLEVRMAAQAFVRLWLELKAIADSTVEPTEE
jgi:hypothetical protein